ncbi:MAG: hypothetical protein GY703_16045 [Gammaproteobacteria bacterium]|nr:hypothetical protein [Gammaproteobacteria bacterium]
MKNREIKASVADLIASGAEKSEVFSKLVAQGGKEKKVAHYIASYPDERLGFTHNGKVKVLVTIMFVQVIIAFLLGYGIAIDSDPTQKWLYGGLAAAIPLLLLWGFYKQSLIAYNAYILLSITQFPRQLSGFFEAPVENTIALGISLVILGFVWFVRSKLFPDLGFISPRKHNGEYVFTS